MRYSDPRVKEWMKENPDVVSAIQRQYDELSKLSISELIGMCDESTRSAVKRRLIGAIMNAAKYEHIGTKVKG